MFEPKTKTELENITHKTSVFTQRLFFVALMICFVNVQAQTYTEKYFYDNDARLVRSEYSEQLYKGMEYTFDVSDNILKYKYPVLPAPPPPPYGLVLPSILLLLLND